MGDGRAVSRSEFLRPGIHAIATGARDLLPAPVRRVLGVDPTPASAERLDILADPEAEPRLVFLRGLPYYLLVEPALPPGAWLYASICSRDRGPVFWEPRAQVFRCRTCNFEYERSGQPREGGARPLRRYPVYEKEGRLYVVW